MSAAANDKRPSIGAPDDPQPHPDRASIELPASGWAPPSASAPPSADRPPSEQRLAVWRQ